MVLVGGRGLAGDCGRSLSSARGRMLSPWLPSPQKHPRTDPSKIMSQVNSCKQVPWSSGYSDGQGRPQALSREDLGPTTMTQGRRRTPHPLHGLLPKRRGQRHSSSSSKTQQLCEASELRSRAETVADQRAAGWGGTPQGSVAPGHGLGMEGELTTRGIQEEASTNGHSRRRRANPRTPGS